jgi:putative SOS response-associated peptidase YedK
MPLIIDRESFARWLSGEAGTELLRPADDDVLQK